jgi:citrate synthase
VGLSRDLFPTTFAVARVAGWSAHVLEQLVGNRLIRPQSEYVGPLGLLFVPVDQR